MARGKYSPTIFYTKLYNEATEFVYNAKGELPVVRGEGDAYDEETMFGNYDREGFDSYGYSAYNEEGEFVGTGNGVDRNGYTEYDYLCMSDEQFDNF